MKRALMLGFLLALGTASAIAAPTLEERRQDVRDVARNTLERLYKAQPAAREAIERSAGYAVFSNFGMKILFAGGGKGEGIAVNRKTKAETFMKMVEVQAGLGVGVKKFRLVWVFEKQSDLDRFVNSGWELGAQATAAAQVSGMGQSLYQGAMSISPGVWLYQLTDEGLAAELTAKGTKYYKDDELNAGR
ncbi:MAG TPA: YSC84-related protein [Usitatibacter sp.]|nr:YSC84-related protein [Usitatibacter sp.]